MIGYVQIAAGVAQSRAGAQPPSRLLF